MARIPARTPKKAPKKPGPPPPGGKPGADPGAQVGEPGFGEPVRTADPTKFLDPKKDEAYYNLVDRSLLQPVPQPRSFPDSVMTLAQALGRQGAARVKQIQDSGRIVFHSAGDTGPVTGPGTVVMVADKMVADFHESNPADVPSFFFHLGDVVYSFGEDEYYYDQFYEPFRDYSAPIFAIPGNHDGEIYRGDPESSLQAFLKHFCSDTWRKPPEAGSLNRTTMTQPGVFFALDAPFVRIIGLYSNVLEDPGVISSQGDSSSRVGDDQKVFLKRQLAASKGKAAVIVAVHHPPFTAGALHGSSPKMLADLDECFRDAGVYPHAVLSGHAHNYQRFTRLESGRETPYVIAGSGGHAAKSPFGKGVPIRPPVLSGNVRFENYSDKFGYLRVAVTSTLLSIEFHDASAGVDSKSPADVVTVDLASHKLTTARP